MEDFDRINPVLLLGECDSQCTCIVIEKGCTNIYDILHVFWYMYTYVHFLWLYAYGLYLDSIHGCTFWHMTMIYETHFNHIMYAYLCYGNDECIIYMLYEWDNAYM